MTAIVPVLSIVPPTGRIAPSLTLIVPALVLTGSVSSTKLPAASAPSSTPTRVIVSPAPRVTTALPPASLVIASPANPATPNPIRSTVSLPTLKS